MKKFIWLFLVICCCSFYIKIKAQTINILTNPVPFLRLQPDARSGGMGDVGIATSPDAYAGLWNAGKVAFNPCTGGIGATYSPWVINKYFNNVYLFNLAGFYKISDNQALFGSVRYFNLGNIPITDWFGNNINKERPREFGIDIGYSRKLNAKNGIGIALKYINSDLANGFVQGGTTYKTGNSVAADLGWYHDAIKASGNGWT